jgi:hypothetical protein
MEVRYGLASVEGGRHPGWGTAHRIVPLGEAYLELVAVVDEAEAAQSPFGRWVAGAHPTLARLLGWALRTDRLDHVARRLGLTVSAVRGRVQVAKSCAGGLPASSRPPPSPAFFIEWDPGTLLPGSVRATHPAGSPKIAMLHLDGDTDRLAAGSARTVSRSACAQPAVASIVLAGAAGEIVLDADRL